MTCRASRSCDRIVTSHSRDEYNFSNSVPSVLPNENVRVLLMCAGGVPLLHDFVIECDVKIQEAQAFLFCLQELSDVGAGNLYDVNCRSPDRVREGKKLRLLPTTRSLPPLHPISAQIVVRNLGRGRNALIRIFGETHAASDQKPIFVPGRSNNDNDAWNLFCFKDRTNASVDSTRLITIQFSTMTSSKCVNGEHAFDILFARELPTCVPYQAKD